MRKFLAMTLATGLLVAATHALAQTEQPWSGKPNIASSGNFGVLQNATLDRDRLIADWAKPTEGVQVASDSKMKRNQPIHTFIVFKGCRADPAGNCNVVADYDILGPDGKPYDQQHDSEVWVGHPGPPEGVLELSVGMLGLVIENKDPLGPYTIKVTVTDKVAGVVLHTQQVLTAVP